MVQYNEVPQQQQIHREVYGMANLVSVGALWCTEYVSHYYYYTLLFVVAVVLGSEAPKLFFYFPVKSPSIMKKILCGYLINPYVP